MSVSTADNALFQRWLHERDAHAFAEIVARHSGMVYGVSRRVLGNASDAEEVAQECFIELSQTKRAVKHSVSGWLHALAATRSLDRIRSDKRRKAREARFAADAPAVNEARWEDVWAEVDEAIAALPEKLREPIVCRFLEAQSQEAVAKRLGTSRSSVQRRLGQGIERIRAFLRRRGVVSSTAGLVAVFEAHTAEAAPPTLAAALGKLALSGGAVSGAASAVGVTTVKSALLGGGISMTTKITVAITAAIVALTALGWNLKSADDEGAVTIAAVPELSTSALQERVAAADNGEALAVAEAVSSQADAPSEAAAASSPMTAGMSGRLVDSRGLPVGKARLKITPDFDHIDKGPHVDDSGAFIIRDLAPGRYSISAAWYIGADNGGWYTCEIEPPLEVILAAGEFREDVVVTLGEPIGRTTFTIHVVNGEGGPVAGAYLQARAGDTGLFGGSTNEDGRYRWYHVPDWETEGRVWVKHRDYERQEFVVPIGDEEVDLVMQAKESGGLQVTVVDGKTGKPIPEAEVGKDGEWRPTQEGTALFADLSAADHRIEARAPGYLSGWWRFSIPPGRTLEEGMALYRSASVRVSFQVEGPALQLWQVENLSERHPGLHLNVYGSGGRGGPLPQAEWQEDNTVVLPVSAGHPSTVELSANVKTHPQDMTGTHTHITVSGLVVGEGEEAKVRVTLGGGTCVLKVPKIQEISSYYIRLLRDGDRPGVEVENATYEGVSETREFPANPDIGMYVAGELFPGTYRLRYSLHTDTGSASEEELITFTREHEEIVIEWE